MSISSHLGNKLIEISYELRYLSRSGQKHFSFIIERNKILSIGWNNGWKTDPIAAKYGHRFSGIHSELSALKNFNLAPSRLKYCKLVNIRISRGGKVGLSKPCEKCLELLSKYPFREILYSTSLGFDSLHG